MNQEQSLRSEPGADAHLKKLLVDVGQPWWRSFFSNIKDALFPEAQPPLKLTSRPVDVHGPDLHVSTWKSLTTNLAALFVEEKLPPLELTSKPVAVQLAFDAEKSWWRSLDENLTELLFPQNLPPLQLTAKPVPVRPLFGFYDNSGKGAAASLFLHGALLALLVAGSMLGAKVVHQPKPLTHVTLVDPDVSVYLPLSNKRNDTIGGGGGGGDRDKLQAPQGKMPKQAMEQFTPPAVVLRNEDPKLPIEPTVVVPPEVKLPNTNLPNLGDPLAKVTGPPSNGTGSGSGIGTGSGGGVGSGTGPGYGPGSGGGTGGGVFQIGGGVSAPRPLFTPDPEYSEEARRAKHQGTVVLWLVVGPDGRPRDLRVLRSLGLGLDEKAMEAVRQWKFEPARKNGTPVAVRINVEVDFKLY
ncbi:MAG: energy transducer TonB [Terriglobales bacterium]